MHEKLVKQLRNTEHCGGCPYDEDCNEFDSCLMDLLAADAIEDMSKRIVKLEKELQYSTKEDSEAVCVKPDIIKDTKGFSKKIDGYIGVYCRCGKTLYIKNIPSKARQRVDIECPCCGFVMHTVYTRYSSN